MRCGTPLESIAAASRPGVPVPREIERKVVTALFCDVVGSTELAERLDPEDVDALLRRYHTLARRRIEANGGTLEKFIGDAVLGVFGAPQAHEDDPTRAVRAALRVIRDIQSSELGLHVRIGVHTGDAVVRVGEHRSAEEGLATGDTLNTAARLQNVAPIDGIVVSEATYKRAAGQFEWMDLGEVSVKGKAEPIKVWQPIHEPQAEMEPSAREATPFLGRNDDLATLAAAFDRTSSTSVLELVTIVAEAGMGKSRLVREMARRVTQDTPGVVWRRGRCLPYGDGISFWALGEIVKSNAGILETDDQDVIGHKLDASLLEIDPNRRHWLRERVAPLVGLRTEMAPPPKEEAFAAWRQFILSLTVARPAVIVIEDLHWADAAFVEFLIELVDNRDEVPLLVLVTARPEVADRHPSWLERAHASTLIQLVSLDDAAIAELVESALTGASPELVRTVLDRAAGSPLYAEQLTALIRERGLLVTEASFDASVIPPTIQALLAARIDELPRELKPALLDASVIGKVFWSGAVASLEGAPSDAVSPLLVDLARRELTRSVEPSTMTGETEYGFWHAILRDVAYSFLPRAARLAKHRAAAAWITDRVDGRLGDLAEIVADHLRRALELAEAIGADEEVPALKSNLAAALLAAAEHAMRVRPDRAEGQLEDALALLADDDERRGDALVQLGRALWAASKARDAAAVFVDAQGWRRHHGDPVGAAELAVECARAMEKAGEFTSSLTVLAEARPVLVANPGPGLASLLAQEAFGFYGLQKYDEALARADQSLALARQLGLPEPHRALITKGSTLLALGDRASESEIRRAIALALASGHVSDAVVGYANLAGALLEMATAADSLPVYDETLAFIRDHGLSDISVRATRMDALDMAGRYDEILQEAPLLRAAGIAAGDAWTVFMADMFELGVALVRGVPTPPLDTYRHDAEAVGFPPSAALGALCVAAIQRGDRLAARTYVEQALSATTDETYLFMLAEFVSTGLRLDDLDLARRLLAKGVPPGTTSSRGYLSIVAAALVDEAGGDVDAAAAGFATAATYFRERQWPFDLARALAGSGRCGIARGDRNGGVALLRQARDLAEGLKAGPLLAEIDAALNGA